MVTGGFVSFFVKILLSDAPRGLGRRMDSVKVQAMPSPGDATLGHFDNDLEHLLVLFQLKGERLG